MTVWKWRVSSKCDTMVVGRRPGPIHEVCGRLVPSSGPSCPGYGPHKGAQALVVYSCGQWQRDRPRGCIVGRMLGSEGETTGIRGGRPVGGGSQGLVGRGLVWKSRRRLGRVVLSGVGGEGCGAGLRRWQVFGAG